MSREIPATQQPKKPRISLGTDGRPARAGDDSGDAAQAADAARETRGGDRLVDRPMKSAVTASGAKPADRARGTFREFLTQNESRMHLLSLMRDLAKHPRGPWREYISFFAANQSGQMSTMAPDVLAKCEKIAKELNDEYMRQQGIE